MTRLGILAAPGAAFVLDSIGLASGDRVRRC